MENLRAIGLMITAMIFFTLGDTAIKVSTQTLQTGQLLLLLGLLGGGALAIMTRAKGHRVFARDFLSPALIWRNLSELVGTLCMFTALSLVDLSTVAAILQATPLAVTLGAAVVLREHVGWRRWLATFAGFIGVLIIMRPGGIAFDPNTLWALAAMVGLSMRDLSTRLVPRQTPTLRMATYGMLMLVPAGLILLGSGQEFRPLNATTGTLVIFTAIVGVAGYIAITAAMRIGEVSVVSPFRYTRIIFAIAVGAVVFGERPDGATLLGAALTVLAGLYIFMREGRRRG